MLPSKQWSMFWIRLVVLVSFSSFGDSQRDFPFGDRSRNRNRNQFQDSVDFNPFTNNNINNNLNNNQRQDGNTFSNENPPRNEYDFQDRKEDDFDRFGGNTINGPRREYDSPFRPSGVDFNSYGSGYKGVYSRSGGKEKRCPLGWDQFEDSCYRFVSSPIHNREDASRNCQAYGNGANLVSINTLKEHGWIVRRLLAMDPQHRRWYVSARQATPGTWINADGSQLHNLDQAFLPDQPPTVYSNLNFLAYSFSDRRKLWGLLKVTGYEPHQYICEVPLSQVPYIIVEDRDFDYGIIVTDPKKIPRGPYFIKEPKSVVFDLSKNTRSNYISLNCLAGGWPAPEYEWFKEEYKNNSLRSFKIEPLRNVKYTVSGGSLVIHNPEQNQDRGNYHCVAKNKFGSIISETVSLSFGSISEFIAVRAAEYAKQYWGKAIYCDPPQHFPGVHFYWSRTYFPNLLEEDRRVFVSFDGNLYISSVDESDRGKYSCSVQSTVSSSGRNGPFFNVTVTPSGNHQQLQFPNNFPKIFPQAPKAGDDVRLECIAFGYPVPTYNWTRLGSGLPRNAILSNYNRVITIKNVSVEDQGEYVCRATNSRFSIKNVVTLSIQAAPHFTIPLGNKHLDKGSDLIWTCEAFGIPDVSYQWYRNGKLLSMETVPPIDLGRYLIQDNVLNIRQLDEDRDAGMYQCRANNSLDAKYSSGQLRVLVLKPSFQKHPVAKETIAAEQGNVTIQCQPEAAPRPKFIWRKDGFNIGSAGRKRILPNGELLIDPVTRDDEGIYTCVASNTFGRDESSGKLTVVRGPQFAEPLPMTLEFVQGTHMFLRCHAETDDNLDTAYIWYRNGLRINDESYRVRMNPRKGYLEIFNLTLADRGLYECIVDTWVGDLKLKVEVDIKGPPGPPGGVEASKLSSTNATVRWTDGAMNGAEAYMYTVQGRTKWDAPDYWETLVENQTAREVDGLLNRLNEVTRKEMFILEKLSPWCAYKFRVIATNEFGPGPPSAPSPMYNTMIDVPHIPPRNVSGGGGKTGTLTISWDPLSRRDQNAPNVYYKIFWRLYNENIRDEYQSVLLKDLGNVGSYAVAPIPYYYTLFEVRVQAWNEVGPGPISEPSLVYSAEDMPQVTPSLVKPVPFNSTAINITWIPVEEIREKVRGELLGYRIRYWPKKGNNLYDPEALNYLSRSKDPHALIVGLQPNTYYFVQVSAYNAAGPGPLSEPQFERTLKKAPQKPPTTVNVVPIDPSTIKVTWRYVATTADEESLQGYKVRIREADQDISQAKDHIVKIGSKLEATIGGLEPLKTYVLRVLGYSEGGDGKMSSPVTEFVLGDPSYRFSSSSTHQVPLTLLIVLLIVNL